MQYRDPQPRVATAPFPASLCLCRVCSTSSASVVFITPLTLCNDPAIEAGAAAIVEAVRAVQHWALGDAAIRRGGRRRVSRTYTCFYDEIQWVGRFRQCRGARPDQSLQLTRSPLRSACTRVAQACGPASRFAGRRSRRQRPQPAIRRSGSCFRAERAPSDRLRSSFALRGSRLRRVLGGL